MQRKLGLLDDKPRDPLRLAQMYEAAFGRADFDRFLETALPDGQHRPGELHRRLLMLPWADVLTTNYDTLLERAAAEVYERRYERIQTPEDIPLRRAPRLVKLHGTTGTGGRLIATQEDYRRYRITHAPFVNLVREAVMETVFVLIGFAGDDPNFLEWTGWVRDELGELSPKIYLCGLLDTSAAELALLQQRRVTPLDLSPLFPDGADRHSRAIDWLLAALENGKPGRETKWAPREKPVLQNRTPALPSAKVFTAFWEHPANEWRTIPLDKLRSVTETWKAQRQEYPGWHVAPDSVRERIAQTTEWWRNVIFLRAGDLPPVERLHLLFELCWRLELRLSPIFTNETDRLVGWLESVNPFDEKLSLPGAHPVPSEQLPATRIVWRALGLHVLRTAREDIDDQRYGTWRTRLLAVADCDRALLGELAYEEVLLRLNRLDLVGLQTSLNEWRSSAEQPLEKLRLAAVFAELGDREVAGSMAAEALGSARDGEQTPLSVSLDAWASLLLGMIDWHQDKKRTTWHERVEQAKKHDYSPWETIHAIREKLSAPRIQSPPAVQKIAGFDLGSIRRSHRYRQAEEQMPAWNLLRLVEKAPCPLHTTGVTLVNEAAANAAAWIGPAAPFWSFSILLRTNANADTLNEVFGRETVALLEEERVSQMFTQTLNLVAAGFSSLGKHSNPSGHNLQENILRAGLELLSRLTIRLTPDQLTRLTHQLVNWLSTEKIALDFDLRDPLANVATRLIRSLPPSLLPAAVELFLPLPVAGEPRFQPQFPEHYKEPFNWLWGRECPPPPDRSPEWSQTFARLLSLVRSDEANLRNRAFTRLHFLNANGWLNETEQKQFEDAVWAKVDPALQFPLIRGYYPHVILSVEGAAERNVPELLKQYLLRWQPPRWRKPDSEGIELSRISDTAAWLRQIQEVFRHPQLATNGFKVRCTLTVPEAEALLQRLLDALPEWSQVLTSPKLKSISPFDFAGEDPNEFVDELSAALGDAIFFVLPQGHALAGAALQALRDLHGLGYPILGATVGWLHQQPDAIAEVTAQLAKALVTKDDRLIGYPMHAIIGWQIGARAHLVPALPTPLVDLIVARIALRTDPGLDHAINTVVALLKSDAKILSATQENLLLTALEEMEIETSSQRLRQRYEEQQIDRAAVLGGLNLRRWAGRLARALSVARDQRQAAIPAVLRRWQTICVNDPLPEVRQAWQPESE